MPNWRFSPDLSQESSGICRDGIGINLATNVSSCSVSIDEEPSTARS
jgi:hypothetical protein